MERGKIEIKQMKIIKVKWKKVKSTNIKNKKKEMLKL